MTMALEFPALGVHHSDLVSPYISFSQPDGKRELLPEQKPSHKGRVSEWWVPAPALFPGGGVMSSIPGYPHADRR